MEPIQVYMHEEYDLQITKPKSYFSLLPSDVKKIAYNYFEFFPWDQLDELIERDNPEEFEFQELPIAPFNWRVSVGFDRAIKAKKWNSAQCFLKWGADPNSKCQNEIVLLHAVIGNNAALVESLFNAGAKPPKMKLKECWRNALEKGSGKIVRLLMEKGGMKPNSKYPRYSILFAVAHRNHDAAKALLAAGADVNRCHEWEGTPLYIAVNKNDILMARILLDAGALPTLGTSVNSLCRAAMNKSPDMVQLLLKYTKQVDPTDPKQESALEFAVCNAHFKCVQVLLDAGANPERNREFNAIYEAINSFWALGKYEDEHPEWIKNTQQTLRVLIAHIHKSKPVGPRIAAWLNEGHRFCTLTREKPKRCHFCEFLPELQKQFGQ